MTWWWKSLLFLTDGLFSSWFESPPFPLLGLRGASGGGGVVRNEEVELTRVREGGGRERGAGSVVVVWKVGNSPIRKIFLHSIHAICYASIHYHKLSIRAEIDGEFSACF